MITVTGSLAFDHIMDYPGHFADHIMPDKIHQINLSFLVNTLNKQKGGTAGNIAYTLALLKTPVSIVGSVGSDFSEYANFLKESGVDISQIRKVADSTSSAFIMTDLADNQITAFYPGAMSQNSTLSLSPSRSLPRLRSGQESPPGRWLTDLVVISPNDPKAMIKFSQQCQDLNIPYMLDPGMQLPALEAKDLKQMLANATILIGNDYEISLFKEKTGFDDRQILDQVKILITTLGEKGSIIQTHGLPDTPSRSLPRLRSGQESPPGRWLIKAAKPKQVVDPTGAGDAYRAGFIAGYIKNLDLKICGQMGSVAACYAIEKYGTTNHKFTVEEFKEKYEENFGEELPSSQ